jgi:RNA polymerase sigma-70 factor, ECF subfamily
MNERTAQAMISPPLPSSQPNPHAGIAEPPWPRIVELIRSGDPSGMEELYKVFSKGIRFYLCRHLGQQDLDDRVHDVFLIITEAIRNGELREPERFMGYVRTVVRRHVASQIDSAVHARRSYSALDPAATLPDRLPNPERVAIENQTMDLVMRLLHSIPRRDREVLIRFYLDEQRPEVICRELNLTENQFRLIKSRAKARFGQLGKNRFSLRGIFRLQPRKT